ncbi:hypothetical protein [Embleya sp. NPDC001921]
MTARTDRTGWTPCPACATRKPASRYLCRDCWALVPAAARRALHRSDDRAMAITRLRELHSHLHRGLPLDTLEITP